MAIAWDPDRPRRLLRLLTLCLLGVLLVSAGHSFLTYDGTRWTSPGGPGGVVQPGPVPGATPAVVATVDGVGPGQLVAFDDEGDVAYWNDSLWLYHDVDPSPRGDHTVTYVASDLAEPDACSGTKCIRNVIDRVNLTTGEVTRLHAWTEPRNGSSQTHDVDRVNDTTFLVADISYPDRVYMVDVTTGRTTWEWRVAEAYAPESGGWYPGDWTHLNDVEYLPDGRVMANLRNQDQVVFIEPGEGIQSNWTLGTDDEHATLFEPHNPDYIPASRGGPAVVVADSENNRLVEYQRENGSWVRTWTWRDSTMQWPRDADRLASGRTLVADSHGQRLLSVAPNGTVAWSWSVPPGSYDVERLGTGDESADGASAARLGLASRRPAPSAADTAAPANGGSEDGASGTPSEGRPDPVALLARGVSALEYHVVALVPPLVLHGLLFALPAWATPLDAVIVLGVGVATLLWLLVELSVRLAPRLRRLRAAG